MQIELKITADDMSGIMQFAGVLTALASAQQRVAKPAPTGLVDASIQSAKQEETDAAEERIERENVAAAETKKRARKPKETVVEVKAEPAATITTESAETPTPLTPEGVKAMVMDYGNLVKTKLVDPDTFRTEVYAVLAACGPGVLKPDGKPSIAMLTATPALWPRAEAIISALSAAFKEFNRDDATAWATKRAVVIEGLA